MSLFNLPSRPAVPFNGVSGAQIERLETTQGLQFRSESFASQRIEFRWTAGSANYWYVPSRSYLRMRIKLELKGTSANIIGDEFNAGVALSPSKMNQIYLTLLDDQRFDSFASALLLSRAVRRAYKAYLDLDLTAGGQAEVDQKLTDTAKAVRTFLTSGGLAGLVSMDATQVAAVRGAVTPLPDAGSVAIPGEEMKNPSFFANWKNFLRYNCLPAIAPAHCGAANLFSSLTLTYGGQVVSSINSHVAQVDAFDKRTSFTANAFARDGLGNTNNFYAPDFIDRCAVMTSDYIEFLWQPPLAFFRFPHAVPSGDFRLNMTVDPKWKENTFQVVGVNKAGARLTSNDYDITEMQLTMWNHFVQGPSTERAAFVLDLDNIVCQAQQSLGETNINRQFDISPDTTSIALAHTDMSPGPYLSSRTLFRYPARKQLGANGFIVTDLDDDQVPIQLQQYQILFDGKQWPQQQGDPMTSWKKGDSKYARLVQQYHETHSQTGLGYNSCGPETYTNFKDSGLLLYTTWPRANSNATRLQLNEYLDETLAWQRSSSPIDILIFTRFKRSFLVRVENGRVMRVETAQNTTDSTLTG